MGAFVLIAAANNLARRLRCAAEDVVNVLGHLFKADGRNFEPLCLVTTHQNQTTSNTNFDIKSILGDGFLWAVPKSRRTVEKRLKRKFGHPDYVWKMLVPRTNIRTCNTCGDDHELGVLCPTCYKKVMDETKAMQDAIQAKLQLDPVEKEVVVLYDGEKPNNDKEQVVEMSKPRPSWFGRNLLQTTTQKGSDDTGNIKPSDLG